jgi:hypothetical protein
VINSAIAYPCENEKVTISKDQEFIEISGWAHGDGESGSQATKVEISVDGGATWESAHEYVMEKRTPDRNCYSWTLWKYQLAVPKAEKADYKVLVRAEDNNGKK